MNCAEKHIPETAKEASILLFRIPILMLKASDVKQAILPNSLADSDLRNLTREGLESLIDRFSLCPYDALLITG